MDPVAVWKDLCIDALDREAMARFWAVATGLSVTTSTRNVSLDGPTPAHRIWVNQVDRPPTVKNRLHLDVDAGSVDELTALGATVLQPAEETGFRWSVMADPEGNEFCAFVREPDALPSFRLHGIGVDCVDPAAQAAWWGAALGVPPTQDPGDDWWSITGAAVDARMTLDFSAVPEPRHGPNRVHWDLYGDVAAFLAARATRLWDNDGSTVLADPEGNEFCVYAPLRD